MLYQPFNPLGQKVIIYGNILIYIYAKGRLYIERIILKPNRNRKHYAIEINSDGQIIVRTPAHSSKQIVDQLIQKNQDWIQKRKHQLNQKKQDLSDWIDDKCVFIHGKKYFC